MSTIQRSVTSRLRTAAYDPDDPGVAAEHETRAAVHLLLGDRAPPGDGI
ncbi:hypothetical protein [Compostimonas suwonensis]|nr:hypothetical protein [Compostimonas suwonensis]